MASELGKSKNANAYAPVAATGDLAELYLEQQESWPAFREAVAALQAVEQRTVHVHGDPCVIQHNPVRIRSTGASISASAIAARPCFLCGPQRPVEQSKLELPGGYEALCNPFPIFFEHFTLVKSAHIPQTLTCEIRNFLTLCQFAGESMTVFFNGATAGASAPDHLHFQAAPRQEFALWQRPIQEGRILYAGQSYRVARSERLEVVERQILRWLEEWQLREPTGDELLNLLGNFDGTQWSAVFIPRNKHRPSHYFREGSQQILVSPAAVELAGMVVMPDHGNFLSADGNMIEEIFAEVVVSHF